MSTTTRITEPTQITQGDRVAWTRTISDYPATLYTLEYRFRSDAGPGFNVTADADGDDFDAVITSAQSATAKAGKYAWQAWLTEIADATHTFAIQVGNTTITPGFATDAKGIVDLRSPAKQTLDAIDAALLAAATSDVMEYEISTPSGMRRVKRRLDLLTMRKEFAAIVAAENTRERLRRGGPFMQTVGVRFYDE